MELVAALTLLTIGFLSLAASLGSGFRQVAQGRQRQSASEVGNGRIEHLRNVPYLNLAVSSDVVHNPDQSHPDFFVNDSTNSYDYSGNGTFEPLIEDAAAGQVQHFESPVVIGETELTVYQYVTWVNDPDYAGTQDYRRVTIVVVFINPAVANGVPKVQRISSFFTPGGVSIGGSTPTVGQGTTGPSATPTPSPSSTASACAGDTTQPQGNFAIQAGAVSEVGYTASVTVTLGFTGVSDPCTPISLKFSNDGVTYGASITYDALNPSVGWTVPVGDGSKSVWGRITDGVGNVRSVGPHSIQLDTTKPTVPGTLTRTASCSGTTRTVTLSWGASTDINFRGYRIYKSINNLAWTELGTVSGTTKEDSGPKSYDSLRYYVVGYDKPGNESNATNTIALAKNQCS